MAQPTPHGIVFRTDADLRPEGRAGPLSRSLDAYGAYWEKWALDLGVPGAHQGPAGGRRRRARPGLPGGGRAPRLAGAARPRRRPGGPGDEGPGRGGGLERGPDRPGDQAGPGRHARHRVRRPAAPARPRPPRPRDPLAQHPRRPRRARPGRLRRHRPGPHPRRRLPVPAHGRAPPAAASTRPRSTPCRPTPASRTQLARVLGYRDEGPSTALDQFDAAHRRQQSQVRSIHEKLFFRPLLEAFAGTGPLSQRGGRGAAGRLRLPRRGPHPGRPGGADHRPVPALPADGAALPAAARMAVGDARPRPRAAPAPPAGRGPGPVRGAGRRLPGVARAPPSGCAGCSAPAGWSGDALRRHPEFVPSLAEDDGSWPGARAGPSWSRRRSGRWPGGRAPTSAGRGCAASSAGSCCGSPPGTCWASPPVEAIGEELADLADASVEAALRELAPPCPSPSSAWAGSGAGSCRTPPTSTSSSSTTGSGAADFDVAEKTATRHHRRDRRDHRRGPDVPHRRQPAARGEAGAAGPLPRRLPLLLRASGR